MMETTAESKINILQNSLNYLSKTLVWPSKETVFNPGKWFFIKQVLITISSFSLLFGSLWQILGLGNTNGAIDYDITVVVSLVGTYYFNFSFVAQIKNLSRIYKELSNFADFGKPKNFDADNARLNKLSRLHFIYIGTVTANFSLSPHHRDNSIELAYYIIQAITGKENPFNRSNYFFMFLSCVVTLYSAVFSYTTSSIISFTIMESFEYIIIRLRHVQDLFTQALDKRNEDVLAKKLLGDCISYHDVVMKLAKNLNQSFNACMFLHVLLTGVILGCAGNALFKGGDVLNSVILLCGWFLSLFMVSNVGERLIAESLAVEKVIAESNWYELNLHLQKDLVPVILKCQKPLYLTVGPFGHMAYQMVLKILKSAYSCLTLMATYQT